MELVTFQNSLADHNVTYSTIQDLISKIQTIPNHQGLKLDPELTLYVCKVVENIIGPKVKTSQVDKANIAIIVRPLYTFLSCAVIVQI